MTLHTLQERADASTDWRMYSKDGRDYFYNAKTGKSTWKVPAEVAAARTAAVAESVDAFATLVRLLGFYNLRIPFQHWCAS